MYYTYRCPLCNKAVVDYEDPFWVDEDEQAVNHIFSQLKQHLKDYHASEEGSTSDADLEYYIRKGVQKSPTQHG